MDTLRDTVENRANDILKEAEALRGTPANPYPREYAVENVELDKYRIFWKASITCKEPSSKPSENTTPTIAWIRLLR